MEKEKRKEIVRTLSREEAITLLEKCNGKITIVVESNSAETTTLYNNDGFDAVQFLETCMRKNGVVWGESKLMHKAAFRRAFELGCLEAGDDHIVSHFDSRSLLAYFCGRVFSGDSSKCTFGQAYWVKGEGVFPGKMVERVFGVANLRELRKKHIRKYTIAKGYKVVDRLFVA